VNVSRASALRVAALMPIPLAFAAGALGARSLQTHAPQRFAVDFAQPFVIVTAWGSFGSEAFAILGCTLLVATIALVLAARALVREPKPTDTPAVVAIAACALACAFAWPFAFSSDVYAYAAYGAMVRDGLDPYALLPAHAHGAFYDAARWQWSGVYPVCVYGPAFVALATGTVAAFASLGAGATLTALRVGSALAFLGSIACLAAALAGRPRRERAIALYAYGLNPVILWSVAEGHNDAWLLLVVIGAAALRRSLPRVAAIALGASLLVKAPGAVFAAAVALDGRLGLRRDRASILGSLAAGFAAAAALCLTVMWPAFTSLGAHGKYAPAVSVQGLLGLVPSIVLASAAAAYGAKLLLGSQRTGYAWLGIALLVGLPNGYPWYALWLVPFALAAGPGRASLALWIATISSVMRYLPDAAGDLTPAAARIASLVAALPLLYALDLRIARFRKKVSSQP
jgi:hypothetical protein